MVEQLINLMNNQNKHLKQLLQLLEIQYKLIIKKDAFGLEELVGKINECSKIVAQDEIDRRKLLGNINLKNFVAESKNKELQKSYDDVKEILKNLNNQKETNEMLLKQQISFNMRIMDMMNPSTEVKKYNSYGNLYR